MAVTAKFIADFSGFLDAVTKADTKLRDFGAGAATVEKSLNRMVDNFSGRKLIEDATKAAEAVDRIGGASKLTDNELQRVAKTAAEAAEKMTKLGIDVPPKIADLAGQVRGARTAFDEMRTVAVGAGTAIAAAFTVRAVANFVEDSISAAHELRNLSIQTRIGTDELQAMAAATAQFGVDSDQLGRAIFQLSRRIAGGDASAVAAIHQMGIGLDEVKELNGADLFEKMLRGLNSVQGSLKDNAASELFGSRLGASLIAVSARLDETIAKVRQTNTVMSKDAVEAAAHYADALDRVSRSAKAIAINIVGPLAEGANTLIDVTQRSASTWDVFKAVLQDFASAGTGGLFGLLGTQAEHLATVLDKINRVPRDIDLPKGPTAAPRQATDEEIFTKIQTDALKELTPRQEKFLSQLFDIGQLTEKNANSFKVNADQMAVFKKREEEIIQTQQTLSTQLEELGRLETEVWKNAAKVTDEANKESQKRLDILDRLRVADTLAGNAAIIALNERNNPTPKDPFNQALDRRDDALRQAGNVDPKALTSSGQSVMAALQAKAEADFDDALAKIKAGGDKVGNGLVHVADVTHAGASVVGNAFAQIQGVADAAKARFTADQNPTNNVKSFLDNLADQTVSGDFRRTPDLGRTLFNLATAHRASGGPVTTGSPYMVGENGPELFTPGSNGFISPTPSGGHTFNISVIGATGADHAVLAERIKRQIESTLRGSHRF